MTECDGLSALRRLAHRIGADANLVQGAGGNVSIKVGNTLWIKASGTWLADAEQQDIMVQVALAPSTDGSFAVQGPNPRGLRPSIETSLHAALPHPVVLHVHSVDTIALAVRADAAAHLEERLRGLAWALVPYRRPGPPLTAVVRDATAQAATDIFILSNHGLVVAAPDVAAAGELLQNVVRRLAMSPRAAAAPSPGPASVAVVAGFRPAADPFVHTLATDPTSLGIATAGVLYPDHVVFLGSAPLVVDPLDDAHAALARLRAAGGADPRWIIVRGREVLIAENMPRGGAEMLRCLADVAARIPADAQLSFLSEQDVVALTDWEAERYRQTLAETWSHDDAA